MTDETQTFVERYDQIILDSTIRSQYGDSGFYNVGDWSSSPASIEAACSDLVRKHIRLADVNSPDLVVVDVGCGLGDTTALIAASCHQGSRVVGINISDAQVAEAKRRHPDLAFQVMDATNLMFEDASVDRIIAVESMFHFNTRAAFLTEARRVLKTGGRLVTTDMLFRQDSPALEWWVPAANRGLRLDDYPSACRQAGLVVESIDDITATTWTAFCAHLRTIGHMVAADRFEMCLDHYVIITIIL